MRSSRVRSAGAPSSGVVVESPSRVPVTVAPSAATLAAAAIDPDHATDALIAQRITMLESAMRHLPAECPELRDVQLELLALGLLSPQRSVRDAMANHARVLLRERVRAKPFTVPDQTGGGHDTTLYDASEFEVRAKFFDDSELTPAQSRRRDDRPTAHTHDNTRRAEEQSETKEPEESSPRATPARRATHATPTTSRTSSSAAAAPHSASAAAPPAAASTSVTPAKPPSSSSSSTTAKPYVSAASLVKDARPYVSAASLIQDAKPYVSAASRIQDAKPYVSAAAMVKDAKPYVSAASMIQDARPYVSASSLIKDASKADSSARSSSSAAKPKTIKRHAATSASGSATSTRNETASPTTKAPTTQAAPTAGAIIADSTPVKPAGPTASVRPRTDDASPSTTQLPLIAPSDTPLSSNPSPAAPTPAPVAAAGDLLTAAATTAETSASAPAVGTLARSRTTDINSPASTTATPSATKAPSPMDVDAALCRPVVPLTASTSLESDDNSQKATATATDDSATQSSPVLTAVLLTAVPTPTPTLPETAETSSSPAVPESTPRVKKKRRKEAPATPRDTTDTSSTTSPPPTNVLAEAAPNSTPAPAPAEPPADPLPTEPTVVAMDVDDSTETAKLADDTADEVSKRAAKKARKQARREAAAAAAAAAKAAADAEAAAAAEATKKAEKKTEKKANKAKRKLTETTPADVDGDHGDVADVTMEATADTTTATITSAGSTTESASKVTLSVESPHSDESTKSATPRPQSPTPVVDTSRRNATDSADHGESAASAKDHESPTVQTKDTLGADSDAKKASPAPVGELESTEPASGHTDSAPTCSQASGPVVASTDHETVAMDDVASSTPSPSSPATHPQTAETTPAMTREPDTIVEEEQRADATDATSSAALPEAATDEVDQDQADPRADADDSEMAAEVAAAAVATTPDSPIAAEELPLTPTVDTQPEPATTATVPEPESEPTAAPAPTPQPSLEPAPTSAPASMAPVTPSPLTRSSPALSPQPASAAAPSSSTLPLHGQHAPALPHSASFTTAFAIPSLGKSLPPVIIPKSLPPSLQASPTTPNLSTPTRTMRLGGIRHPLGSPSQSSLLTPSSLPALSAAHLQQLAVMHQHHSSQQQTATALTLSRTTTPTSTVPISPQPIHQQQQMAALIRLYQEQRSTPTKEHQFSSAVLALHHRYAQDREERKAADAARTAATAAAKEKRRLRKYFLGEVKQHHAQFVALHKEKRKSGKSLASACARIEADLERKRDADESKAARLRLREAEQRLAALKANDLAAYGALIKDCKSQRIQLLLQQTTKWEEKLRSMIRDKKSAGVRQERDEREKQDQAKKKKKKGENDAQMDDGPTGTTITATDATTDAAPSFAPAASSSSSAAPPAASSAPSIDSVLSDAALFELDEASLTQPRIMTGGVLKPYQLTGIQWLVTLYNNHLNGILADEMGLGKTIQTVGLIAHLMESRNNPGPYLIIAPLSTQKNWRSEFAKWAPSIRVVAYTGTPDVRTALWKTSLAPGTFNVVLISFEYIMNKNDRSKLSAVAWKYIIIDEGHRVKNHQSKLSRTLAERYRSSHRVILSGTPLQNSLVELWSLLNWLLPSIFDSADSFQEWFSKPFAQQGFSGDPADQMLDEEEKLLIIHRLHSILRPFLLRRMKVDVASQLPPKTEVIVKTSLTPWQKTVYQQILSQGGLQTVDAAGQVKARKVMNTFMQLRKIVNHPYLFELTNPDFQTNFVVGPELIRSSGKFDLLHRMLPKLFRTGHRVLLFSQMTKVLDLIEDMCEWKKIKFVRLDGHSTSQERSDAQDAFNAPGSDINLFIMSTRAGGLGLNLQVADTVILFDSDWNPQADVQAMDRAHRIGQQREVRIFRLISLSPAEEQILSRAQQKLQIDQIVIQSGKFDNRKQTTSEERKELLQDILRQSIHVGQAAAPTDEEVNRMMCRSEEEFDTFQCMDKEITDEDEAIWRATYHRPCPGRFVTEDELPPHVRHVDLGEMINQDEQEQTTKRAARNNANYSDMLSDREWTKCIEEGLDPVEYAKKKRDRQSAAADARRGTKRSAAARASPSSDVDEDDEDDVDVDDEIDVEDSEIDEEDGHDDDGESESVADQSDEANSANSSDSDESFVARRSRTSRASSGSANKRNRSSGSNRRKTPTPAASSSHARSRSRNASLTSTPAAAARDSSRNNRTRRSLAADLATERIRDDDRDEPMIIDTPTIEVTSKRSNKRKTAPQVPSRMTTEDDSIAAEAATSTTTPTTGADARAARSRARASNQPQPAADDTARTSAPSRSSRSARSPSVSASPPAESSPVSRRAASSQRRQSSQPSPVAAASPSPSPQPTASTRSSRSSGLPPTPSPPPDEERSPNKRQRRR